MADTINVNVNCGCGRKKKRRIRIVPHLGRATEQTQPVLQTPQFKGSIKGETIMAFDLVDSQQVTVSVSAVDKKGNPAPVQSPTWQTSNTDVLALTPAADGMSCLVAAVGPVGTAGITFNADADMGDGVTPIAGTLDVNVVSGAATTVTLTPGTPTDQP